MFTSVTEDSIAPTIRPIIIKITTMMFFILFPPDKMMNYIIIIADLRVTDNIVKIIKNLSILLKFM